MGVGPLFPYLGGGGLDENYSLTHQPKAQNATLIAYSRSRSDNGGTSTATGFRRAAPSRKQLEVSVKQTGHLLDYGLTTKLGLGLRMSSSGFFIVQASRFQSLVFRSRSCSSVTWTCDILLDLLDCSMLDFCRASKTGTLSRLCPASVAWGLGLTKVNYSE